MNETELYEAKHRGDEARRVLEHPLIAEAVATLTKNNLKVFGETDPTDTPALQVCRIKAQCIQEFVQALRTFQMEGKNAAAELAMNEKLRNQ